MAQQIPLSLRSFGRPFERLLLVIYKTQVLPQHGFAEATL